MEQVYNFLKKAGAYYIATYGSANPRVHPQGTFNIYEGRLYIQMGRRNPHKKPAVENPRTEICAYNGNEWIRIEGTLVEDNTLNAQQSLINANPSISSMQAGDENTVVFYLKDSTATIYSYIGDNEVINF